MQRDLNEVRGGGRQLGSPQVGRLGSLIPSSGALGAAPLYNDVVANGWSALLVSMYVISHTLTTLFVREDLGVEGSVPGDGTYTITYEVQLVGVAQTPDAVATIVVGPPTAPTLLVTVIDITGTSARLRVTATF